MGQIKVPSTLHPQRVLMAFLILMLALTLQAQKANPVSQMVKVKRGQTLSLLLLTPIDSGHVNLGDDVTLKLVRPLVAEGATVIPVDWIVHGKVTKVKRAGKNCKEGEVAWKLDRIMAPGGDQLMVQRVHSYPFDPSSSGDPVWVPLDAPLAKIGGAAKFTGLLAVSIPLSPLLIPMAIFATEPCEGKAGEEQSIPPGLRDLFAVSKGRRVRPLP